MHGPIHFHLRAILNQSKVIKPILDLRKQNGKDADSTVDTRVQWVGSLPCDAWAKPLPLGETINQHFGKFEKQQTSGWVDFHVMHEQTHFHSRDKK